jgi:hypothetical protein
MGEGTIDVQMLTLPARRKSNFLSLDLLPIGVKIVQVVERYGLTLRFCWLNFAGVLPGICS